MIAPGRMGECALVDVKQQAGLAVVDKPSGMTSHDVVSRARKVFGTRAVGHAGTLDPLATGVLVLGIGRATKLLGHLALDAKSYTAAVVLGANTVTDDAEGETLSETDASAVTEDAVRAAIAELTGTIQQVPSAVSAVKVDGKRAYARVREGEQVELAARTVTVSRFSLESFAQNGNRVECTVSVDVSSGTYVRALARDLGAALGVGGHLNALRRTVVGPFTLEHARPLEELALSLDLDAAVAHAFPAHRVDEATARAIRYGQRTPAAGIAGTYGVLDEHAHAIAIAKDAGPHCKTAVVLDPA